MGRLANLPMPFWNVYTYPGHGGLDWEQKIGTPVPAIADGYISYAAAWGPRAGFARTLTIPSLGGLQFIMCHLDDPNRGPRIGSRVRLGEIVAYTGNSGRSTGPHLHGEMWLNGVAQREEDWFDLSNWVGKNGKPAGGGSTPITEATLLEDEMILIAQRADSNKPKGRYNPANGRIREITRSENNLLRNAIAAGAGNNVVYSTVSDKDYAALLTGQRI